MGSTAADDDQALEQELRSQLQEQIHGLADVEEALLTSPDDADLLELKSQLEQGIQHFRDSLVKVQQHNIRQQQQQHESADLQQHEPQLPEETQPSDFSQQQEQQGTGSAWDQHLQQQQQQQDHVRPRWLLPGVHCRFRFSDGQWWPGVVHEWLPQQQLPVSVHFTYPTR